MAMKTRMVSREKREYGGSWSWEMSELNIEAPKMEMVIMMARNPCPCLANVIK